MISRIKGGSGRQRIRVRRNGLAVAVRLGNVSHPVRFGKSIVVWWAGPSRRRPTPLKVTLKSLLIRHSDPDPIYGAQTSPWLLYLNVNGYWQRLNRWLPQLGGVHDGHRVAINRTVKVYVPRRHRVWLQVGGLECDEPGGGVFFGIYVNNIHPCPANTTEVNPNPFKLLMNDNVGVVLDIFRSARASLGRHVSTSEAPVRFPGTGEVDYEHGSQGNRAFDLTYVVRRARR